MAVKRKWMPISVVRSLGILALAVAFSFASSMLLSANDSAGSRGREAFLQSLKLLADHLADRQLTPRLVGKILGREPQIYADKKVWSIEDRAFVALVFVGEPGMDSKVSELKLVLRTEPAGVKFQDVERIFGEWVKIHESKTSSVLFQYSPAESEAKLKIYVDMLFPPRFPDSPVTSITIRGEESM